MHLPSRLLRTALLAALACGAVMPALHAQAQPAAAAPGLTLKVGDVAPDFKLRYFDGAELKQVSLSDYRGKKNVVLAFYVFAFTGG